MNQRSLPKALELQLLKRLATDDAFRSLFQNQPREALLSAGVDEATIDALDPFVLEPGVLADKRVMEQTYERLMREELNSRVGPLVVPVMRVNYSKAA